MGLNLVPLDTFYNNKIAYRDLSDQLDVCPNLRQP